MHLEPLLTYGLLGLTFGVAGGLSPGPITALVVSQTLRFGRLEGFKVSLAPVITDGPLLIIAMFLAELVQDFDVITGLISIVGSLVLIWLAIDTFKAGKIEATETEGEAGSIGKAVITNLTNPHPYVFWFTIGAPTAIAALQVSASALVAFVMTFALSIVGAKIVIAYCIDRYRSTFEGPAYRWTMRCLAAALLVLSIQFARSGLITLSGSL
jgi:threonine/homoserine/homoserine lactone efflux protein